MVAIYALLMAGLTIISVPDFPAGNAHFGQCGSDVEQNGITEKENFSNDSDRDMKLSSYDSEGDDHSGSCFVVILNVCVAQDNFILKKYHLSGIVGAHWVICYGYLLDFSDV